MCQCRRRPGGNTHAIRFVETVNDEDTYARFESQQIIVPVFRDQHMLSRQFACPRKSTSWIGLNQRKSDEAAPTIKNAVSDSRVARESSTGKRINDRQSKATQGSL